MGLDLDFIDGEVWDGTNTGAFAFGTKTDALALREGGAGLSTVIFGTGVGRGGLRCGSLKVISKFMKAADAVAQESSKTTLFEFVKTPIRPFKVICIVELTSPN